VCKVVYCTRDEDEESSRCYRNAALKDYMSDETLFVPEPNQDLDAHRVEMQADELHPNLVLLRKSISRALDEHGLGEPANKHERLAALLDLHNSETLLSRDLSGAAWHELQEEFVAFKAKMCPAVGVTAEPGSLQDSALAEQDSGGSPRVDESSSVAIGKRKQWQGALNMRKEQRRKMGDGALAATKLKDPELDSYKAAIQMSAMSDSEQDVLEWWLERCGAVVANDGSSAQDSDKLTVTQLPVLAHIAAQYHSVDSCSVQAKRLLQDVGYRMPGLEKSSAVNRIENMLFLRINKQLVGMTL
jgi:hypothetical protein